MNAKSLDVPRSRRQTEDNNNNVRVYEGDFVRRNDDTSRPAFREPEPVPSGRNRFEQPNEPPKRKSPLEVLGLDDDRRYRDDFYNSRSRSRDYYRDPRDFRPREPARDFHRDEPKADWERSLEAYQKERSYNSSVPPWSDDRRYRW